MWWAFIVGLVFAYPIVEMVEEWRQRRSSIKDLSMMRKHIQLRHRWDVRRGQWVL
jgi:hypothetical protein